jgi:hypothetical protein
VLSLIGLQEGVVNPVDWRLIVVTGDNENVSLTQVLTEEATTPCRQEEEAVQRHREISSLH